MAQDDLAQAIVEYLEAIPATISPDILFFVSMYATDEVSMDAATFLPKLREALLKSDGVIKMGATLRTVAALDHVLERAVSGLPTAKATMQDPRIAKLRPDIVSRMLAGHDLRERTLQ